MNHPSTYAHTDTTRPYTHSIQQHTRVLSDSCSLGASANPVLTLTRTSRRRDFSLSRGLQSSEEDGFPLSIQLHPSHSLWLGSRETPVPLRFPLFLASLTGRHTGPKEKASWDVKALPRNQPGDPEEFLDLGPQLESRRLGSAPGCWDAQRVLSQERPRVLVSEA